MTQTIATRQWPLGTVEYLHGEITADVTLEDDEPIKITFDRETYYAAEWIGSADTTRTCRVLVEDDMLPAGAQTIDVFAQVTDDPEVPLIPIGTLEII